MRAAALAAAASHESDPLREETMNSHARTVQPPAGQTPFDLERVIPTMADVSILEAVPG